MQDAPYVTVPLRNSDAVAIISPEDAERCEGLKWHTNPKGYVKAYVPGAGRDILLHRLVIGAAHRDGRLVDHVNRDRLDNRRINLRFVTSAENVGNCGSNRDCTSTYRGVSWQAARGTWLATLRTDGIDYFCGRYRDELDAARAVEAARRKHLPISTPDASLDPIGECACARCRRT